MKKIFLLILVLIFFAPVTAFAVDFGADKITVPSGAGDALIGQSPTDSDLDGGLKSVMAYAIKILKSQSGSAVRTLALLMAVALITGFAQTFSERAARLTGILASALTVLGGARRLLDGVSESLIQIDAFSKSLLPVMAAATAASGAPASAAVRHAATILFSDLLITGIQRLLLPALFAYIALITADAAAGEGRLDGMARLIKWGVSGSLKIFISAYVAYLTVAGAVAGSADALLEKGAKLALSGMVPVVGGIISDATQTVVAGAGVIRSSLGVFGLLAVLGIVIAPCAAIGINCLLFKVTAALCDAVAPKIMSDYLSKLADTFALLLGMTASAAFLLIFSIVSCLLTINY